MLTSGRMASPNEPIVIFKRSFQVDQKSTTEPLSLCHTEFVKWPRRRLSRLNLTLYIAHTSLLRGAHAGGSPQERSESHTTTQERITMENDSCRPYKHKLHMETSNELTLAACPLYQLVCSFDLCS